MAPPGSDASGPSDAAATTAHEAKEGRLGSISWRDIVVVPRRKILKYHRFEIMPTYNATINNPLYRHHGFGGILNFFLSETFSIGAEATYYQQQQQVHYFLRGLDDRVLPSVNRYWWSAALNFGYVPFYGKFALFDRWVAHWEGYVGAGVGIMQTEWIPRDPANKGRVNFPIVPWHVDIGMRLFLTKWLTIHAYLKDYMMIDNLEPSTRTDTGTDKLPPGESNFIQNIVFGVGVGMFLPTSFEYKYTR